MYIGGNIIQDCFGNHYRLHIQGDAPVSRFLEAKQFSGAAFTERFVRDAQVSSAFWQRVLSRISVRNFKHRASLESCISTLLIRGTLKLYPIKHLDEQERSASPAKASVALPTVNGKDYTLAPASVLLVQPESRTQTFASQEQAVEFLTELKMDDAQRNDLATAMKIPAANQSPDAHIAAMAVALMENQFVIIANPPKITPRPKNSAENAPVESTADTPPSLGPHDEQGSIYVRTSSATAAGAAVASNETDETKPPCSLEKVVIKCSHGSNVEITTETRSPPSLSVIATETDKTGFDRISAEIQASTLCSSHKNSSFNVSKEHTLTSKTDNKIEFKVNCAPWNRSNIFGRIWLPSIKPKTYGLAVKETCEAPDIQIKKVNINVYPDIKWHWSTQIDFGKLEFIPGKAKVKYSAFTVDGNVDLTYDGEKHDAKEKYKEYITKPLDGFKKICDSIAKVLEVINDRQSGINAHWYTNRQAQTCRR